MKKDIILTGKLRHSSLRPFLMTEGRTVIKNAICGVSGCTHFKSVWDSQ